MTDAAFERWRNGCHGIARSRLGQWRYTVRDIDLPTCWVVLLGVDADSIARETSKEARARRRISWPPSLTSWAFGDRVHRRLSLVTSGVAGLLVPAPRGNRPPMRRRRRVGPARCKGTPERAEDCDPSGPELRTHQGGPEGKKSTEMRFAAVGSGIPGLVVARLLHRGHDITVFEANAYPGGHTNTIRVDTPNETHQVDAGFSVFNDPNYPNFERLLDDLTPHYVGRSAAGGGGSPPTWTGSPSSATTSTSAGSGRSTWPTARLDVAERPICDVQLLLAKPRAGITSLASRDRSAQNQRRGLSLSA